MTNGNDTAGRAVAFRSIGCRTNQEEAAALRAKLSALGYAAVDEIESAGVVIINTCSVTSHTESKTGRFIRSVSKDAPNARILVTGCFAEQHGGALLKYPGVVWAVGNGCKHLIPSIISRPNSGGAYFSDINSDAQSEVFWEDAVPAPGKSGRTRFSIKIQEGCDFKCAYCIVPSLRGRSRSLPQSRLVDIFKRAVDSGYGEIVLTGTHIGQYRGGVQSGNLESLLEALLKIPGDYRIRLSSLDPRDLTDTLMAAVGEGGRICDHLHVSVQSLCADVLSFMGRPHAGLDALIAGLCDFRGKYPRAGLGGDFIAGHPGESGEMFEATLRCAGLIGFNYGHVFRYSKRAGTPAALMPGQISESVKKERSGRLRDLLAESRKKYLYLLFTLPKTYIIVEDEYPVRGVSGNYVKIEVPGARAPKNTRMRVALTGEIRGGYCVAEEITR